MASQPYSIDRERYPFVLRDGKKPICSVYDTGILPSLAKFPALTEEVARLREENDRLSKEALGVDRREIIKLLEYLHRVLPDSLIGLRVQVGSSLLTLKQTAPAPVAKAQVGLAVQKPAVTTPMRPEIGQIWASKRKPDDLYEVIEVKGQDLTVKWMGSSYYIRETNWKNLQDRYTYHSMKEVNVPGDVEGLVESE